MQFENSMDLDMDEDLDTLATQSPTSGRTQHQKDEETAAAEAKAASTMEATKKMQETTKKMQEIEAASTVEENAQRSTSAEALHGYKTGFKPIPDARDLKQMLEMVM